MDGDQRPGCADPQRKPPVRKMIQRHAIAAGVRAESCATAVPNRVLDIREWPRSVD
jgi:hypothetical protein